MNANHQRLWASIWRNLRSWKAAAVAGVILVVALLWWVWPQRIERVVSADGTEWEAREAPGRRQVVWTPARPLEVALPVGRASGKLISPRLADGGATLYFTFRGEDRQADLYRARLFEGRWQPAEPVAELNSAEDDIGPVLTPDGRELYFYSNRPGGLGRFDLYVSRREGARWSTPRNLGPGVNSPAHEYDPALAPDGRSLYFSSNRTPAMAQQAAEKSQPESGKDWAATLRSHPGLTQFDLYVAVRPAADQAWGAPEPLTELNLATSNEGAPFVSPNGKFLYFASDRPARAGEKPNLDLYRARLVDLRPTAPEGLGHTINTAFHETEPALSPEGFTLVFSSNRDGTDSLYQSTAEEVHDAIGFDTMRWDAFAFLWWRVLLLTLLTAGLFLAFFYRSGWILEKAMLARFLAASLLVHMLFVMGLWVTPLREMATQVAQVISGEPAPQLFDEPGQVAPQHDPFGARAELGALERPARPELARQALAPAEAKLSPAAPLDLPAPVKSLPLERAQFEPPAPAPSERPLELPRQAKVQVQPPPETQPVPPPPAAEAAPQEKAPAAAQVALLRKESVVPTPAMPALPTSSPEVRLPRSDVPLPAVKAEGPVPQAAPVASPLLARAQKSDLQPLPDDLPAPALPAAEPGPQEKAPAAAQVALLRRETAAPTPAMRALPTTTSEVRLPRSDVALPSAKSESPVPQGPTPVAAPLLARAQAAAPPLVIIAEKAQQVAAPASDSGAKALDPSAASVAIARRDTPAPNSEKLLPAGTLPSAPLPTSPSGLPRSSSSLPDPVAAVPKTDAPAARQMPERLARLPAKPALVDESAPAQVAQSPMPAEGKPTEKPVPRAEVAMTRPAPNLPDAKIGPTTGSLKAPELPKTAMLSRPLPGPAAAGLAGAGSGPAGLPTDKPVGDPLGTRFPRLPGRDPLVARVAEPTFAQTFVLRKKENRDKLAETFGGTKETEAAVERGLDWLAAHQSKDGSWSLNQFHVNCQGKHPGCGDPGTFISDTGGTALALLPFFGAGYSHQEGKHQQTVARGLRWLTQKQTADGSMFFPGDPRPMYGQGLAAIVLCEAYGMTKDPALRDPAQRALNFIIKAQNPTTGGWRYQPGNTGDTSVMGWQVMALKSGELAGLTVPSTAFEGAKRWLASVEANKPTGGLFGYMSATPSPAMTAQALLSLQLMGTRRDDPRMRAGTDFLLKNLPNPASDTSYYWYHANQVMYHMQGEHWKAWNERMRDHLVKTQAAQGALAGSWAPIDARERAGGRICSTALRLLMLEVYYRHLPLYRQFKD